MFAIVKSLLKRYWKTLVWIFIMCYLLFSPGSALPKPGFNIPHSDKVIHAGMFAVLVFLFRLDSRKTQNANLRITLLIIGVFAFGTLSEYLQHAFIPGRSGNVYDLLADIVGIFIGLLLYYVMGNKAAGMMSAK